MPGAAVGAFQWILGWLSKPFLSRRRQRYVLRLSPKAYYTASRPIPFEWLAFKPTHKDHDGVSVYQSEAVTPEQLAASGRKPGTYFVARLSMSTLRSLKLTVVPTPGPLPGHAVIPELRKAAYDADKEALKEVMLELARLAGQDIVLRPNV